MENVISDLIVNKRSLAESLPEVLMTSLDTCLLCGRPIQQKPQYTYADKH
jgi:hypothetical protein